MNSGYKVDLAFNLEREYLALSYTVSDQGALIHKNVRTINKDTYPDDYYERRLEIEHNTIFRRPGPNAHRDILRSCANTATFPTLTDLKEIEFPTSYKSIPYDGIPLLPVRRGGKSFLQNDSFFGTERFFAQQVEGNWGSSFGLDFYFQFFNQEDYAPYNFIVLTWPKEPVEEE